MNKLLLIISLLIALPMFSQQENKHIRRGNKLFEKENFTEAEVKYRKALEKNPFSQKSSFNLGDAHYMQKNYDEALKQFTGIAKNVGVDSKLRSSSWYNSGNVMLEQKKYQESIDHFKDALRLNPKDEEARYNLEYARQMLKKQQQDQKQDQNQDQKQDQKQDQQQNQDKKEQEKKENEQKQNQEQNKDQKQEQKPQPNEISKQEAQRMLEAMKNSEQKTMESLKNKKAVQGASGIIKDW